MESIKVNQIFTFFFSVDWFRLTSIDFDWFDRSVQLVSIEFDWFDRSVPLSSIGSNWLVESIKPDRTQSKPIKNLHFFLTLIDFDRQFNRFRLSSIGVWLTSPGTTLDIACYCRRAGRDRLWVHSTMYFAKINKIQFLSTNQTREENNISK